MAHKAGLNEEVIIRGATELIDAEGLQSLTLARLAERLGVKSPSLYKHVAGLEDIQRGIAVYSLHEATKRMTKVAIGKSGDEAVHAIANALRSFAKERPGLYASIIRAPEPQDEALIAASEELLAVIRAVLSPYALGDQGLVHAIRGFRSLVHGFVSLENAGGFGMPIDVDKSFQYMIMMFLNGLKKNVPSGD